MAGLLRRVAAGFQERIASTWRLLSDTTSFLSRTSLFHQYEGELMELRRSLSTAGRDDTVVRAVRLRLTEIRASLRIQGYDLTLGALELSVKGFRGDASVAQGFRRLVVFIGERKIWVIAGDENHRVLHDYLESDLERSRSGDISQKHYLWYQWRAGLLTISGADSEAKDDFEDFKAWCEQPENRLLLLGRMRKFH